MALGMPSLVSDLTSSAMTLSRAASMAARTSSSVATFLVAIYGNPILPSTLPTLNAHAEVRSGQDPERGHGGSLAQKQDHTRRDHTLHHRHPLPDGRHRPGHRRP